MFYVRLFLVEYPGDTEISSEEVYEYDSGESNGEGYIEYGMYGHGEDESV